MASNAAGHKGPDQYLQTIVVNADEQTPEGFIGRRLARHVTVDPRDASGKIWVRNASQYYQGRTESLVRAENGSVRRIVGKNPGQISYECEERALDVFSDAQKVRRNEFVEDVIDEDTGIAVSNLQVDEEIDIATLLLNTATYPAANTARMVDLPGASGSYIGEAGAAEHDDLVLACNTARRALRHRKPNALAIDIESIYALQRATDRAKAGDQKDTRTQTPDEVIDGLASRLGIPREHIFVASAQVADPDTEVWSDIWQNTEGDGSRGFALFFRIDEGNVRPVSGGVSIQASLLLEVHEDLGATPGAGSAVPVDRMNRPQPPLVETWEEKKPVPGQNPRAKCSRALVMLNSGGAFLLRGLRAAA